jgi:hypothetical protein
MFDKHDSSVATCAKACRDYLSDPWKFRDKGGWAEEQQARFNIWAANLGVFADSHASLGRRLRDSSNTYLLISQLLDALHSNLGYCEAPLEP